MRVSRLAWQPAVLARVVGLSMSDASPDHGGPTSLATLLFRVPGCCCILSDAVPIMEHHPSRAPPCPKSHGHVDGLRCSRGDAGRPGLLKGILVYGTVVAEFSRHRFPPPQRVRLDVRQGPGRWWAG